jgi:hypothetical protein
VFIPGRTGINNGNSHHIHRFYFYPNFTEQILIYVMMQVLVLSFMLCDVQILQKDYVLFSFDSNKLHANIIYFFWSAVLFSKGGKIKVGKKGGIKEKLGRERTGNPKKGTYQTYSTSSDKDFLHSFGV